MGHQDWARIETELGELMPRVDTPAEQPASPPYGSLANNPHRPGKDSMQAVLEQIARALEDGKITPGAD